MRTPFPHVLLPLLTLFLSASATVLRARQVAVYCGLSPVDCGGGYCCMQFYVCKPDGTSYLCVDTVLTANDGIEHTVPAYNPSSDNAIASSLGITYSTVIVSVPTTTATAKTSLMSSNAPVPTPSTGASQTASITATTGTITSSNLNPTTTAPPPSTTTGSGTGTARPAATSPTSTNAAGRIAKAAAGMAPVAWVIAAMML